MVLTLCVGSSALVSALVAWALSSRAPSGSPVADDPPRPREERHALELRIRDLEATVASLRARLDRPGLAPAAPVERPHGKDDAPREDAASPVDSGMGDPGTAGPSIVPAPASTDTSPIDYASALTSAARVPTIEEVRSYYVRMVKPLVENLEPKLTEVQVEQIHGYLKDGEGARVLAFEDVEARYLARLSEEDRKRFAWDQSVAYNTVSSHIKRRVLSTEQARYFPYGRRYHEQK